LQLQVDAGGVTNGVCFCFFVSGQRRRYYSGELPGGVIRNKYRYYIVVFFSIFRARWVGASLLERAYLLGRVLVRRLVRAENDDRLSARIEVVTR
jgi:hypothetical protein